MEINLKAYELMGKISLSEGKESRKRLRFVRSFLSQKSKRRQAGRAIHIFHSLSFIFLFVIGERNEREERDRRAGLGRTRMRERERECG